MLKTLDKKILRELIETPSISGHEGELRGVIREYLRDLVDKVFVDKFGNLIAKVEGAGKGRVMIDAHMDQIGFMISEITEEGLVKFTPVGELLPQYLVSQNVIIFGKEPVEGVIHGIKLKKGEEKYPEVESLYVDIGASKKEETEKYLRKGDVGTYLPRFKELSGKRLLGTAFDNKSSVFLLIELAKRISPKPYDIYFVFAAQEEVGLRGTRVASYNINPDVAIVLDVTFAKHPPIEEREVPIKLGEGPAIAVAPSIDSRVLSSILRAADKEGIKRQLEVAGRWTGTDTDYIAISREGVLCGLISIPLRYMHSPNEVICQKDLEGTLKLVEATLEELKEVKGIWRE